MKYEKLECPDLDAAIGSEFDLNILDGSTWAADRRLNARDGVSRRKDRRVKLEASARLRGASQGGMDATIQDLSAGGCSLAVRQANFFEGDLVVVKIDGIESWPGIVKWVADELVGVKFDRPFYPAVFDAIVAANNQVKVEFSRQDSAP